MKVLSGYLADFISLLFPELCQACSESLIGDEKVICTACIYGLPYTNAHLQADNIVARQFWGKLNIEAAYALYYFTKGGKVQNLIHQLKYQGMTDVGKLLGRIAGDQLVQNPIFNTVDLIMPVPLHKSKQRKRGYNQSTCFADGLAEKMNAKVEEACLIRTRSTESQTHKSRFSRFENMKEVFAIQHGDRLAGKHILLVDDVITTGSTLEACSAILLKIPGLKLSIATIAYAE
jgi:ComF family protein